MINEKLLSQLKRLDQAIYVVSVIWEGDIENEGYPFLLPLADLSDKMYKWISAAYKEFSGTQYTGYRANQTLIIEKEDIFDALLELKDAFYELNCGWDKDAYNGNYLNDCNSIQLYPFHKCFNELTHDVIVWVLKTLPSVA